MFVASPSETNLSPQDIVAEAQQVLQANLHNVAAFFKSQRHNAHMAGLAQFRKTREFDHVGLTYLYSHGNEFVEITIRPPIRPGPEPPERGVRKIPLDATMEIICQRTQFPIPGAGGVGVPDFWRYDDMAAVFDPGFASVTGGTARNGETEAADIINVETPGLGWVGSEFAAPNETPSGNYGWLTVDPSDPRQYSRYGSVGGGWSPELRLKGVAVTGIYPEPIKGRSYWEVEIIELPDPQDMPGSIEMPRDIPGLGYGDFIETPTQRVEDTRIIWMFPTGMTAWFNPCIGLAPKYYLDAPPRPDEFDDPHEVRSGVRIDNHLGLDPDIDEPRTIWSTRVSFGRGTTTTSTVQLGEYWVDMPVIDTPTYPAWLVDQFGGDSANSIPGGGGRFSIAPLNFYLDPPGTSSPPADGPRLFIDGDTIGMGDSVLYCWRVQFDPGYEANVTFLESGPPVTGTLVDAGIPITIGGLYDAANGSGFYESLWYRRGTVGGVYRYDATQRDLSSAIVEYAVSGSVVGKTPHSIEVTQTPDVLFGDLLYIPNDMDVGDIEARAYAPVYMGRGDITRIYQTASPETPTPTIRCVDTGVELGDLQPGDRLMWAVDADSGKVWVGINGRWLSPEGEIRPEVIAGGRGHIALLDTMIDDTGATRPVEYHPAATLRFGLTHVKFHFGASCAHPPPQGFQFVAQSIEPITVPE